MAKDFSFILKSKAFPLVKRRILFKLQEMSVKHFNRSFDRGGFTDKILNKWRPSARALRTGDKTLQDRGDLRRSIRGRSGRKMARVVSDLKYSARHNEGLKDMPKRQFMGESQVLNKVSKKIIKREIDKLFR